MTFPANNPGAVALLTGDEVTALHGNTKTAVDAVTTKLEAMRLLLVAIGGYEDGVEGFVDGLEALMGTNNVALGAPGDAAWTTGNGSTIALLKAIAGLTAATNTAIAATNTLLGDTTTPAPITATTLPLPTGASTETTLAAVNTKTPTQGQKVKSGSVPVTLASDHDPIDTVVKSTGIALSAMVGFAATATSATSASTTLPLTVTAGVPMIGQVLVATGITAGTTVTAVSGTGPAYTVTLSAAATVASGAAVTSVGPQILIPANTARRGYEIQNQSGTANLWTGGVGVTADYRSRKYPPVSFYDTPSQRSGTADIWIITDTPATPVRCEAY